MPFAPSAAACSRKREMPSSMEDRSGKIQLVPADELMIAIRSKCRGGTLVDAHCFGTDRRPPLTDDDGARGAAANQAGSSDHRRTNWKKFHTKLNSRRTAKLRLNVVAA